MDFESTAPQPRSKLLTVLPVAVVLLLVLAFGGFLVFSRQGIVSPVPEEVQDAQKVIFVTPRLTPTGEPTATPSATVEPTEKPKATSTPKPSATTAPTAAPTVTVTVSPTP